MAFAIPSVVVSLLFFFFLLPPLTASFDLLPPLLSPIAEDICKEAQCGKGTCKSSGNSSLYECECDPGWKQTRFHNDDKLKFLPCIVPNCSLEQSCSNAPSPAQEKAKNSTGSILDVCHWVDCGGGSCNKTSMFSYGCVCDAGFYNLLNVTAFPCFRECSLGMDCKDLGIALTNSSSAPAPAPPPALDSYSNDAGSIVQGSCFWMLVLILCMAKIQLQ